MISIIFIIELDKKKITALDKFKVEREKGEDSVLC